MPHVEDYDHSPNAHKIIAGGFPDYVVTYPGRSQYSHTGGGVSACGLAALNCARVVLSVHNAGLGGVEFVQALMTRELLEDILKPCLFWSSSAHLAVDDIFKAPVFQRSLQLIQSDYGQAGLPFFNKLLAQVSGLTKRQLRSSCVIITRPPEIIACFCIANVPCDLFVIFDSHPRPDKHPHGAAFIFKNSAQLAAEYLSELLRYDERLLTDSAIQWQAQLLAHCSGDIFVARDGVTTSQQWADLALDASLQVLSLQARVRELESSNENLEADNKRLGEEVSDLEDKILELDDEFERLKVENRRLRREGVARPPANGASSGIKPSPIAAKDASQSPVGTVLPKPSSNTPSSQPTNGRQHRNPVMSFDPVALQLQHDYDTENRQLQYQLHTLQITQPALFDCAICLEKQAEDFVARVMPCGHTCCRQCIKEYVVSKIETHRYPILCPMCTVVQGATDPSVIEDAAVQQLGLTEKQYDVFSEMQLARFSTIIHCRKCQKTLFVDKKEYEEVNEIVCPLPGCGHAWCKLCSQALEIGGPKHSCDGSSELNHLMSQRGWKHCPGCQTPAEKIEGCNHMTCMSPGCNAHFCYLCGQLIVQSVLRNEIQSQVSRHYSRCTLF